MSVEFELRGSMTVRTVRVTKWWSAHGSFRWTLDGDTLDAVQIVALFASLDPLVAGALLDAERERRGEVVPR
jgi:hypothetical protein